MRRGAWPDLQNGAAGPSHLGRDYQNSRGPRSFSSQANARKTSTAADTRGDNCKGRRLRMARIEKTHSAASPGR